MWHVLMFNSKTNEHDILSGKFDLLYKALERQEKLQRQGIGCVVKKKDK